MAFQDHFSKAADQYAQYRPHYPDELYDKILNNVRGRELAWDVATGNGQAAAELAKHFRQVIATDPSSDQIANAMDGSHIHYKVEKAEESTLDSGIADLITVAVGAHWLDLKQFEQEVQRVGTSGSVLAIWAYYLPEVEGIPSSIITAFYQDTLKGYWPQARSHIDNFYKDINFSFPLISEEEMPMRAEWTLDQLCGFFSSWSAVNRKIEATGSDPVQQVRQELTTYWDNPSTPKPITWPLFLKMWQVKE